MKRAEKHVFYDSKDGRFVAEFFQGRVYLHLEVRQWGMETARKLKALWPEMKAVLRNIGFRRIYAYRIRTHHKQTELRWTKFMAMFGLQEVKRKNGLILMETTNG